jgi:hypothetical protein
MKTVLVRVWPGVEITTCLGRKLPCAENVAVSQEEMISLLLSPKARPFVKIVEVRSGGSGGPSGGTPGLGTGHRFPPDYLTTR